MSNETGPAAATPQPATEDRRWSPRELFEGLGPVVALWAGYVAAMELLARFFLRDAACTAHARIRAIMGNAPQDLSTLPPFARWDSTWYISIAQDGYAPRTGSGAANASFFPLYGWLTRGLSAVTGLDAWNAAAWLSRLSVLGVLVCLAVWLREREARRDPWPTLLAALCYPSAYILLAVYAESLFLFFSLAAYALFSRRRYGFAAGMMFLAGLTRIHVVPMGVGLGLWALHRLWRREPGAWKAMVPPVAGAAGIGATLFACWRSTGDAMAYFRHKAAFGVVGEGFGRTVRSTRDALNNAHANGNLAALHTFTEPLSAILLVLTAGYFARRRRWAEVGICLVVFFMNAYAGTLWGLPRYTIIAFPVFVMLGRLHRWPGVFYGAMLLSAVTQVGVMLNYVNSQTPAP